MTPFHLKIVTPDGLQFDGMVEELIVRTTTGDMGVQAGHINCVAALGMGRATLIINGEKRYAACIGGMLSVVNGEVTLVPTTFEWADKIDAARAEAAANHAKSVLARRNISSTDIRIAEAKLKRALLRSSVAKSKSKFK
ncbi:MAG: ATP synthase F1 subunit epsilon [Oscillospiraceae bacterium]|nr:ATP synthase F1 subunit epsilon [Oscillospiraceae bacterium]